MDKKLKTWRDRGTKLDGWTDRDGLKRMCGQSPVDGRTHTRGPVTFCAERRTDGRMDDPHLSVLINCLHTAVGTACSHHTLTPGQF